MTETGSEDVVACSACGEQARHGRFCSECGAELAVELEESDGALIPGQCAEYLDVVNSSGLLERAESCLDDLRAWELGISVGRSAEDMSREWPSFYGRSLATAARMPPTIKDSITSSLELWNQSMDRESGLNRSVGDWLARNDNLLDIDQLMAIFPAARAHVNQEVELMSNLRSAATVGVRLLEMNLVIWRNCLEADEK